MKRNDSRRSIAEWESRGIAGNHAANPTGIFVLITILYGDASLTCSCAAHAKQVDQSQPRRVHGLFGMRWQPWYISLAATGSIQYAPARWFVEHLPVALKTAIMIRVPASSAGPAVPRRAKAGCAAKHMALRRACKELQGLQLLCKDTAGYAMVKGCCGMGACWRFTLWNSLEVVTMRAHKRSARSMGCS